MSQRAVAQHCPTPRELDDLELVLTGAAPVSGFNRSGSPITLDLPDELVSRLTAGEAVELVDPEGLPLATVTADADGWAVSSLSPAQFGPFRCHYLSPTAVRNQHSGRTVVAVTDALTDTQHAALTAMGPVTILVLVGTGTPALSPVGLIRATLLATADIDAVVVAVPLADHGVPEADALLRTHVIATYADGDPVAELPAGGRPLARLTELLATERPTRDRQGLVLFFTGLSGSGKSTLARALTDRLLEQGGRSVTSLDGDVVRRNLSAGLTYSKADRETNIRRIGWVAAEIARHGGVAVCSPIAPFDQTRQQVRQYVDVAGGAFFLIHVATPLEECERRDRKGLYAKARRGEIPEFTGISSPYEEPTDADVRVDTTGRSIEDALSDVTEALRVAGYLDIPSAGEAEPTPPATPTASRPLRVLYVCTTNNCTSPALEFRSRQAYAGPVGSVEFASAGTEATEDQPADAAMIGALAAAGAEIDAAAAFRTRLLTRDLLDDADLVLTTETEHRDVVLELAPAAFRKVFTIGQFAETLTRVDASLTAGNLVATANHSRVPAAPGTDIADPHGEGPEAMRACLEQIDALLGVVLPRLAATAKATA